MLKSGLHFRVILNLKFDVAKDNNNINLLIFLLFKLPQGNVTNTPLTQIVARSCST